MDLKQYMILMAVGSILGWGTWLIVLFRINPYEAGIIGFLLFYASLAIGLIGLLSLLGFAVRLWAVKSEEIVLRQVTAAFRQSFLFTLIVIGSLFLQSRELLTWWNALIFIFLVTLFELISVSVFKPKH